MSADGLRHPFDQADVKLGRRDHRRPGGLALSLINEHQFDVRGEAQLATAALAQRADREGAAGSLRPERLAELAPQFFPHEVGGEFDRHLGDVAQFFRELRELGDPPQDVPHVDAEHLAVLEGVERVAAGGGVGGLGERPGEFSVQFSAGAGPLEGVDIPQHGKQVRVLHAEEVGPQEVRDSQQAGECLEHLRAFERGEFRRPVAAGEKLGNEVAEVEQRGFGVGRMGKQVGEVLDEHEGRLQFAQPLRVDNFLPLRVGDVQGVVHLVPLRTDLHLRDVDPRQGEGVGQFVQEPQRVLPFDHQLGVVVGGLVVDLDFERVEGLPGVGGQRAEGCGDLPDDLSLRLFAATCLQQPNDLQQVAGVGLQALIGGAVAQGPHQEHIDDFLAGVVDRALGARGFGPIGGRAERLAGPAGAASAPRSTAAAHSGGGGVREDLPLDNVEAMHQQQSGDE